VSMEEVLCDSYKQKQITTSSIRQFSRNQLCQLDSSLRIMMSLHTSEVTVHSKSSSYLSGFSVGIWKLYLFTKAGNGYRNLDTEEN
jgi:hypothetical protein